ncbi:hypothetical protein BDW71DRAFT_86390 [Aspergillus fruticulosus]
MSKLAMILRDILFGEYSPRRPALRKFDTGALANRLAECVSHLSDKLQGAPPNDSTEATFWARTLCPTTTTASSFFDQRPLRISHQPRPRGTPTRVQLLTQLPPLQRTSWQRKRSGQGESILYPLCLAPVGTYHRHLPKRHRSPKAS